MKEIYDWVPWFRELARNIEKGGEADLIKKAKQVAWGNDPSLLQYGDEGIDPFSFFYFLASKNTKNQLPRVYDSVSDKFDIDSPLPDMGIDDYYIFPTPPPAAALLFHDGNTFNFDLLWRLFTEAVKDNPEIEPDDFENALKINGVGVAKLTQTLFLINPEYFLSADNTTFHLSEVLDLPEEIKKEIMEDGGYGKYLSVMKTLKRAFPQCQPYEINMFLYLQKSEQIINADSKFFQIDTIVNRTDYWGDFKENNWVYTSGPGSGKKWGETGDPRKYHLTKPKRGDIILVRTGRQKRGRAIGIVQKNDYAESGLNKNSKIHVWWINKSTHDLSGHADERKFREAKPGGKTYLAFQKTDGYKPSFHLINSLTGNSIKNGPEPDIDEPPKPDTPDTMEHSHPLNQILYGPPGTGKTYNTVNRAVAIIEGKSLAETEGEGRDKVKQRFDQFKKKGQIEMVTFHQNFTYEDFIEGIRPVLDDEDENIEYELSQGVFRKIADRADEDRDQNYVLIIDEINRGNIAKIFGELITLIEPSKRIGGDDATTITLPYSQDSFGVPDNLYIIGTMNTADRSIALLDTALRRRFEFIEMMPDSKYVSDNIDDVDCKKLLNAMNDRIRFLLDREHQIGHTYFMDVKKVKGNNSLEEAFKNKIIPLLQEYFYDNWEKIDLVLNKNGFIQKIDIPEDLRGSLVDDNREVYELLPFNSTKWEDPKSYRTIYEKGQGETNEAG